MLRVRHLLPLTALAALLGFAAPSHAQTIIDEWSSVKAPPAPELKPVTVDPKTTALLMTDFVKQTCNEQNRLRCIATLPAVNKLLATARRLGMTVIYTTYGKFTAADILPDVAPRPSEPTFIAFCDKFILGDQDTGLEKMLKDKGVTTVITVGALANCAILYTASAASLRGFNVIVPVDGISGPDPYAEQISTWQLANAIVVSSKITLTRIGMIKF